MSIGGCLEIQPGAVYDNKIGAGSYSSSGINFINVPKVLAVTKEEGGWSITREHIEGKLWLS